MAITLDGTNGITASGNVTAAYFVGNASALTGISSSKIYNGTSEANIGASNGNLAITINSTANVVVVASTGANVTGTLGVTGNITGGNLSVSTGTITVGNIVNANANAVGNIGSASLYFNTVFAKATSAQYADVAEKYRADAEYPVGTVLVFDGEQEVTASRASHATAIAGTVSENPAYIMNSGLDSQYVATIALLGRVPCRVVGKISRGACLVASDIPGVATQLVDSHYRHGCIVGKALESYNSSEPGVIEIVVGRL